VVLMATWVGDASQARSLLASTEVQALAGACYEAVIVDVETELDFVRGLGDVRVPGLCVLGPDGQLAALLPLPSSVPEFVAVAARTAQQIASSAPAASVAAREALDGEASGIAPPDSEGAGPPAGSIAVVTAKIRDLADFATPNGDSQETGSLGVDSPTAEPPTATPEASELGMVTASDLVPQETVSGFRRQTAAAPAEPHLPTSPPAWPAEPSAPLASATAPPPSRPAIEPAQDARDRAWLKDDAAHTAAATGGPSSSDTRPDQASPTAATESPAAKPAGFQAQVMAALQRPLTFFRRSPPSAEEPPLLPPARPQSEAGLLASAAAPAADPTTEDGHGTMPLGLEGFCPVTLVDRGTWVEGRAQWGARHRGRTYLFAGAEQQQVFLANPDRYAPALSGDDPVLALESGVSTPGQRRFGVTYQSRMYLFASAETRAAFAADPARYVGAVALAERGPARSSDGIRRF